MRKMKEDIVILCVAALISVVCAAAIDDRTEKLYVVHMDKSQMPSIFPTHHHWYRSLLSSINVSPHADVDAKLVYTYDAVVHGFSATLTRAEVEALRRVPGHLESHEDSASGVLHITHSYEFLGLTEKEGLWQQSALGGSNGVIVAVLDTGISPESPSFSDSSMGPVPAKWKGICQPGTDFVAANCNRKIIGARYFNKGFLALGKKIDPVKDFNSARDFYGHGTYTASIVAGYNFPNVDYFGFGNGTAKGMAPRVRLAIYKVGWYNAGNNFITETDVISAMEQAVLDGVDIISASFSVGNAKTDYLRDPVVAASLGAAQKGVLVVASAGNYGPGAYTVRNEGPWLLTVGASTTDRALSASIKIGVGQLVMSGISSYHRRFRTPDLTLIAGNTCAEQSLNPRLVTGNILFCLDSDTVDIKARIFAAKRGGAIAAIIAYKDAVDLPAGAYIIPIVLVNSNQSQAIVNYMKSTTVPIASVEFVKTVVGYTPAPQLATFSSVGPSGMFPEIIKPDLLAPGVNIIAACQTKSGTRAACFRLSSGTSASAPHVAGIAALLKAVHPDWSPAAIKSAMMTTASKLDNTDRLIGSGDASAIGLTPVETGSGHLDPQSAADPGLVYDMGYQDYVNYLCLSKRPTTGDCSKATGSQYDLNLPTISATFFYGTKAGERQFFSFRRSVTKVGGGNVYDCFYYGPSGINVTVTPTTLTFSETTKTLGFTVTMEIVGPALVTERVRNGYLMWYDGIEAEDHQVISPIVAIFPDNYELPT